MSDQINQILGQAKENPLGQLRKAFQIPDSVVIVVGKQFRPNNKPLERSDPKFNKAELSNADTADKPLNYRSLLDTPVYTNVEFLPGSYETDTKGVFKSFGSKVDGSERLRYESVLVTVSQSKKIVKTSIQGRNGTIKEYIGLDDYSVTINGIITGKNGQRPVEEIAALKRMLDAPIAIEVASSYLQLLDINLLVLEDWEMGETEGSYSYQPFSLTFVSDIQQELELSNA